MIREISPVETEIIAPNVPSEFDINRALSEKERWLMDLLLGYDKPITSSTRRIAVASEEEWAQETYRSGLTPEDEAAITSLIEAGYVVARWKYHPPYRILHKWGDVQPAFYACGLDLTDQFLAWINGRGLSRFTFLEGQKPE